VVVTGPQLDYFNLLEEIVTPKRLKYENERRMA
jgi:hypothetical protein